MDVIEILFFENLIKSYKEEGISRYETLILLIVGDYNNVKISFLNNKLQVSRTIIFKSIKKLIKKGYLIKKESCITLKKEGLGIYEEIKREIKLVDTL